MASVKERDVPVLRISGKGWGIVESLVLIQANPRIDHKTEKGILQWKWIHKKAFQKGSSNINSCSNLEQKLYIYCMNAIYWNIVRNIHIHDCTGYEVDDKMYKCSTRTICLWIQQSVVGNTIVFVIVTLTLFSCSPSECPLLFLTWQIIPLCIYHMSNHSFSFHAWSIFEFNSCHCKAVNFEFVILI